MQAKASKITATIATKASYYYSLRNELIHERTIVPVSDREVEDYRSVIEMILKALFSIRFPKAN